MRVFFHCFPTLTNADFCFVLFCFVFLWAASTCFFRGWGVRQIIKEHFPFSILLVKKGKEKTIVFWEFSLFLFCFEYERRRSRKLVVVVVVFVVKEDQNGISIFFSLFFFVFFFSSLPFSHASDNDKDDSCVFGNDR